MQLQLRHPHSGQREVLDDLQVLHANMDMGVLIITGYRTKYVWEKGLDGDAMYQNIMMTEEMITG